jgi:hypothetical protein
LESRFKAYIVWLILKGRVEEALEQLSKHYDVRLPSIKVGLPKRHSSRALGCYSAESETISVRSSEVMKDPSVIIHEFYHHLRMDPEKKHRGTERKARDFSHEFIEAYRSETIS